jgi:hypothetical protein
LNHEGEGKKSKNGLKNSPKNLRKNDENQSINQFSEIFRIFLFLRKSISKIKR